MEFQNLLDLQRMPRSLFPDRNGENSPWLGFEGLLMMLRTCSDVMRCPVWRNCPSHSFILLTTMVHIFYSIGNMEKSHCNHLHSAHQLTSYHPLKPQRRPFPVLFARDYLLWREINNTLAETTSGGHLPPKSLIRPGKKQTGFSAHILTKLVKCLITVQPALKQMQKLSGFRSGQPLLLLLALNPSWLDILLLRLLWNGEDIRLLQ